MNYLARNGGAALALVALLSSTGCSPKMPPVVPVSGTVYLDGQPLPLARLEFVPELKNFGAESNSTAVTDEAGHFTLICAQATNAVVAHIAYLCWAHTGRNAA